MASPKGPLAFITAYAPGQSAFNTEKEQFYEGLNRVCDLLLLERIFLIGGLNAHVDNDDDDKWSDTTGEYKFASD